MDDKISEQKLEEKQVLVSSPSITFKIFINYTLTSQWKNPADTTLTSDQGWTSPTHPDSSASCAPWQQALKRAHHLWGILAKNAWPQAYHEVLINQVRYNPNRGQYSSKSVTIIKDFKSLQNYHRLDRIKETWQPNAAWDTRATNSEIQIKSVVWLVLKKKRKKLSLL